MYKITVNINLVSTPISFVYLDIILYVICLLEDNIKPLIAVLSVSRKTKVLSIHFFSGRGSLSSLGWILSLLKCLGDVRVGALKAL